MIAHGERRRRKVSLAPAIAIAVAALALIAAGGFGLSVVRAEKRVSAGTVTRVDGRGASDGGFSNSPTIARNPARAGNIAAAVRLDGDVPSALLASSEDAGATWRQTQLPLPPAVERPYWPDLAFSPDGTLFVVYENVTGRANTPAHLWLSRSTDGGRSLSRPVQLAGPLAFEPRITAGPEGNVYVTWLQAQQVGQLSLPGAPPAIVAVHSADGGRSFSAPVPLSDTNRTRIGAATPVLTSDGTLIVLYEDFKDDVRDLLNLEGPPWPDPFALVVTRSTDEGQTFAAGQEI
ncbi:MAG TPA: sialidase family protein, partial [Candidatus Sulfotelmatobacter sp.]|nr:sialidase family protein [Candidatus Sulfotelmatobacter sp.]